MFWRCNAHEVTRTEFGSTVREGSHEEEDTLEDLPTGEVLQKEKAGLAHPHPYTS